MSKMSKMSKMSELSIFGSSRNKHWSVSVSLTTDAFEALEQVSFDSGRSRSNVLNRLLTLYSVDRLADLVEGSDD